MESKDSKQARQGEEGRVADSLRAAIERTLAATAPAAVETRERAGGLVDEISKRSNNARDELARRGQGAGAEIARLGHDAREALSKRGLEATGELRTQLDALEQRLVSIEDLLKRSREDAGETERQSKPKAEG